MASRRHHAHTTRGQPAVRPAKDMNFWVVSILVLVVAVGGLYLLDFVGGGARNQVIDNDHTQTYTPPATSANLQITAPQEGDVISNSIVSVRVKVTNFQLVGYIPDRTNVDDQGHILYTLDGTTSKRLGENLVTFGNVAKGDHTLRAELVNNDKTPLFPPVYDVVTFKTQ